MNSSDGSTVRVGGVMIVVSTPLLSTYTSRVETPAVLPKLTM